MTEERTLLTVEEHISARSGRWFALCFLAGWLALLAGDWYMRFTWFEWNKQFIIQYVGTAVRAQEDKPPFTTNELRVSRGGDLSALVGFSSFVEPYEEERPAGLQIRDRYGYANRPYDPEVSPDIVVVGDSFMATGHSETLFSSQLSDVSGRFIYNNALPGHGAFISLYRLLADERFQSVPPKILVWGFAEREITGRAFAGMVLQLWRRTEGRRRQGLAEDEFAPARMYWGGLAPRQLRTSLPNSSFMAMTGKWIWTRARFILFGQIPPEVVPSSKTVMGEPMLFYRYNIEALARTARERNVEQVGWATEYLRDFLKERGIDLIVVLIPEKEQIYRQALPQRFNPPENPLPPSVLWDVEQELIDRNIVVVNLLGPFSEATDRGELLYWRDDTHWNYQGVKLAARVVWDQLRERLETSGEGDDRL